MLHKCFRDTTIQLDKAVKKLHVAAMDISGI